jgi:hypothetical protein
MHIPPSEARELTYYEYSALQSNWEAMHSTETEAPTLSGDQLKAMQARMAAKGYKVH